MEIWKPIPGYEGWYEVSNEGRVRSVTRNIIGSNGVSKIYTGRMITTRPLKKRGNYIIVDLRKPGEKKTFRVNRLVLMAFNPVDNMEKLQVGHKDENVFNNTLENLYWTTAKENSNYGTHNAKLSKSLGGGPVLQYTLDGEFVAEYPYLALAKKTTGITHIYGALSGERNSAGGYIWRRKERCSL